MDTTISTKYTFTSCIVKKCRKRKNLDDEGYCPVHSKDGTPTVEDTDKDSVISDNVDCKKCSSVVLDTDKALDCDLCRKYFHANCTTIPEAIFLHLTDANIQPIGLRWYCGDCINTVESMKPPVESMKPSPGDNNKSSNSIPLENNAETTKTETENASPPKAAICKNYRRGTCKHGASGKNLISGSPCHYRHPRKCPKFIKFGRNGTNGCDKERCELFHPILCRNSVRNSECLNKSCTYTHLKGTARKRSPVSQPVTADNQISYAACASTSANLTSSFRQKPSEISNPQQRENHTYVAPNTQENTMFSIVSALRDIQENQLKLQQEFLRYKNQNFFQSHGRVPMTEMSNPGYGQVSR